MLQVFWIVTSNERLTTENHELDLLDSKINHSDRCCELDQWFVGIFDTTFEQFIHTSGIATSLNTPKRWMFLVKLKFWDSHIKLFDLKRLRTLLSFVYNEKESLISCHKGMEVSLNYRTILQIFISQFWIYFPFQLQVSLIILTFWVNI